MKNFMQLLKKSSPITVVLCAMIIGGYYGYKDHIEHTLKIGDCLTVNYANDKENTGHYFQIMSVHKYTYMTKRFVGNRKHIPVIFPKKDAVKIECFNSQYEATYRKHIKTLQMEMAVKKQISSAFSIIKDLTNLYGAPTNIKIKN